MLEAAATPLAPWMSTVCPSGFERKRYSVEILPSAPGLFREDARPTSGRIFSAM